MPQKNHPALIAMLLLVGVPLVIWVLVLLVGIISSIGEWFSYSTGVH